MAHRFQNRAYKPDKQSPEALASNGVTVKPMNQRIGELLVNIFTLQTIPFVQWVNN